MALGSALVDTARVLSRRRATADRIDGRTPLIDETSQWFGARLTLPGSPEAADPSGGRRRAPRVPMLMFDTHDFDDQPVTVTADDVVEVECIDLFGQGELVRFHVAGQPEPFRRKTDVIGFEVPVRRVD